MELGRFRRTYQGERITCQPLSDCNYTPFCRKPKIFGMSAKDLANWWNDISRLDSMASSLLTPKHPLIGSLMNLTFATLQKNTDVQQEDQDQGIALTGAQ